jgi:ribonucleotide monophosphatase NagD (HAD superfamily)
MTHNIHYCDAGNTGQIAQRYQKMGGTVTHFGKPDPRHFISCLNNLGVSADDINQLSGVAHVGDSLEHDVAGANAAEIDSIFIIGGIHAKDLGLAPTGSDAFGFDIVEKNDGESILESNCIVRTDLIQRLNDLFDERGILPTHVVPSLSL